MTPIARRLQIIAISALVALSVACLGQTGAQPEPDAVLADGARYYGPLVDGLLAGEGRLEWPSGASYEGSFAGGMMHGHGRYTGVDGSSYRGEFKQGQYWGEGELRHADGGSYRGGFVRGRFEGRGRLEQADGTIYEGEFADGQPAGQGAYSDASGARYEGGLRDWQFHGAGVFTDAEGNIYEGEFSNGMLSGPGRYTGKDGARYEGDFENWQFHGYGILQLGNGDRYEGGFRYGRYHGEGTLTYAEPRDGVKSQSGSWRYGSLHDPEQDMRRKQNVELALYRQPALLQQALDALAPGEPGKIDLYLLTVAGDGSQEVFRREAEFIKAQFDRDYGTAGRSLTLVNSRNTIDALPMATLTSIGQALSTIGNRMNKDEDILFLYLTSHGSRSHEFLLAQNGMELPGMPAAELGRLLRDSGIRWKVVVVSACYSGGFIDAVRDDHTLVITAARHDRTSFGCADENDFTYFGRAFFQEALPQSKSFQAAFRKAERLIREWEKDKAAHSLPQMRDSRAIRGQLDRWRAQLPAANAGRTTGRLE